MSHSWRVREETLPAIAALKLFLYRGRVSAPSHYHVGLAAKPLCPSLIDNLTGAFGTVIVSSQGFCLHLGIQTLNFRGPKASDILGGLMSPNWIRPHRIVLAMRICSGRGGKTLYDRFKKPPFLHPGGWENVALCARGSTYHKTLQVRRGTLLKPPR